MAAQMPLPVPPRTPTPPPDENPVGLGLETSPSRLGHSPNVAGLSPLSAGFSGQYSSLDASLHGSPRKALSPGGSSFPSTPYTASSMASDAAIEEELAHNPFNFQTQTYTVGKGPPVTKNDIGRRRGHKYKHSSVSHQIFLEPPPNRAPLQLPASLPIPTWKEYWSSMSRAQSLRVLWCCCHLSIAGYIFLNAHESLSLTVLSRLLFFDALGAFLCIAVDIGSNFEVWKRSSIRHPFGFERSEVVAGLGMSVGLLFMGLDLISHSMTHALENSGGHEAHHSHSHSRLSAGSLDIAAVLAISATLVSALVLKNHARIGRVMRIAYFSSLPSLLSNPSHFLTLSSSTLLLLLPLLDQKTYTYLDSGFALLSAVSMIALGWRLGWLLGKMLMMSYSGPGVASVIDEINSDPLVSSVQEAKFWQVHYGLCQANLKIRVRGLEGVEKLRGRIGTLVRTKLGGGYGGGGPRWDVTTQLTVERD